MERTSRRTDREAALTGRQKLRNLRRDPRVSVVVIDPAQPTRDIELRGTVDLTPDPISRWSGRSP